MIRSISLAVLLTFVSSNVAFAQDVTLPTVSQPQNESSEPLISPMRKDQRAPFTGVLLNPSAVANVKVALDSAKESCKLEVEKETGKIRAQCALDAANLQAENDRLKAEAAASNASKSGQIDDLTKQLKACESSKANPLLWVGIGGVGGILLTLGVVWGVSQAVK